IKKYPWEIITRPLQTSRKAPKSSNKAKRTPKQPSVDISISESVREANKISVGNQEYLIGLETLEVQTMVKAIIKEFADIKTTLTLRELWTPSAQTRAKGIPRPQNAFMLHRKDVSKEFCRARQPLSVCDSSIIASSRWNSYGGREKKFWTDLALVAKTLHSYMYQ
ncbi:166_t:CDS:2, partial [Diversispora eburnea]